MGAGAGVWAGSMGWEQVLRLYAGAWAGSMGLEQGLGLRLRGRGWCCMARDGAVAEAGVRLGLGLRLGLGGSRGLELALGALAGAGSRGWGCTVR